MWSARLPLFACTAILASSGVAHAGGPADLYYERTLMTRAGERCGLFGGPIQTALTASARQARGAALRAGADEPTLIATAARARAKADAVACTSPDLLRAAARVKAGFSGWASLPAMTFPGDRSTWKAVRADRPKAPRWTLSTPFTVAGAPAILGLTSADGGDALTVVTTPALQAAFAVRLVVRDPAKAPQPYLAGDGSPPRDASLTLLAAARGEAPPSLLPLNQGKGGLVRFGPGAAAALAQLDPRESARLEWAFATRTGERTTAVTFEAGDFAAGRAFMMVKK